MTKEQAEAMKEIQVKRHDALIAIMAIIEPLLAFEAEATEGDAGEALEWIIEKIQEED